jgi:hypothetical protein
MGLPLSLKPFTTCVPLQEVVATVRSSQLLEPPFSAGPR